MSVKAKYGKKLNNIEDIVMTQVTESFYGQSLHYAYHRGTVPAKDQALALLAL